MAADPFALLYQEHEAIRARLRSLERALDAAMNRDRAEEPEMAVFRGTRAFLREVADRHFRREEEALLPALEGKVGKFGTLVNVIAYDHDEIRREAAKFEEALAALEAAGPSDRAALRELNRHGIFIVQYLSLHTAKEDSSLAEFARRTLGPEELVAVSRRLEELP